MGAVRTTARRANRYTWLLAGFGVGYVLGARAGRGRYEQLRGWARRTADDFGVSSAVDRVVGTARDTALDLREDAAERSRDLLEVGAQSLTERIQDVPSRLDP
jgi:hypothetical protein